ncbi:putative tRNA modification GTPase TrmE [Lyophyllum shimeji]|uniref:tRNA modification GTPase TrmE n=1 Tax=Lyophyllum shimeji TaxID=47721 RepID=A0A9P3PCC6_LYOSH|nr:putative tRNA modification GTPase TrmE [Lyophyllum shimeji]
MVRPHKNKGVTPEPWRMERCRIVKPDNESEQLDDGLAVYFRGPRSFTTEDVVELHLHSGRAIISSVLAVLSQLPFCRPAEAGEFTRRAFHGGRLDLTQVEGLKDLINAETEGQRRIAMMAAGGTVRARFEELRSGIIGCLANVEALIDFGEGEDIEEGVYEQARSRAQDLLAAIQTHLKDDRRGEIIRSGVRLAIFGPPNAGKSSLLNFLAQREAAIVTPVPGTTRDILELSLDIGGLPVIVADTAGLRITDDLVESIGIERAQNAVRAADISLCVLSLPEVLVETPEGPSLMMPPGLETLIAPETLFLFNKSDLSSPSAHQQVLKLAGARGQHSAWVASLSSGEGTTDFLSGFAAALHDRFNLGEDEFSAEMPLITRERHRVHLESARRFLQAFLDTSPADVVLGAEELRYAAQALGKVSGLIDVEDILDAVFKDFCIGK